jgi:hypothetical protein
MARRREFGSRLQAIVNDVGKDQLSAHARSTVAHLNQARSDIDSHLAEVTSRLSDLLLQFERVSNGLPRVGLIPLTPSHIVTALPPTRSKAAVDGLILSVILAHARADPEQEKLLLSGDTAFFHHDLEVRERLRSMGIRHVSSVESVLAAC